MTQSDRISAPNASACSLVAEAVRKAGSVRLRVSGTSMVPAMRPGDLVTIERATANEIAPGEIVAFARSGRLVAHRVTGIVTSKATNGDSREPLLETRGDRARRIDPMVSSSELLGRVTQIERGSRRMHPSARLTAKEQLISRMLRVSDRATYLFLRIFAL
jgi:signal peptidase I